MVKTFKIFYVLIGKSWLLTDYIIANDSRQALTAFRKNYSGTKILAYQEKK